MKYRDLNITNSILIFAFAAVAGLYFGAGFFIPLTFGAFLAALMAPFSDLLEKAKLGRPISSFISTLLVLVISSGLAALLFWQLSQFANDLPKIKEETLEFLKGIQKHLYYSTGISPAEQEEMLQKRSEAIMRSSQKLAATFLGNTMSAFLKALLVLIYLFLFLLYRKRFTDFIMGYVPTEKRKRVKIILAKTSRVAHHYLWGRIKVMSILAAMYLITFLIFGLRYTILLTIFGALVTVIPYIGPFISGMIPIGFMIVFGGGFTEVILFASVILIIQLIESYVLEPVIIGSEVQLNPLFIIISIIIGGMIWGISGMILFVPLFAVIKIFSDHTLRLKPLGYLIGEADGNTSSGFGVKIKESIQKLSFLKPHKKR